MKIKFLQPVFTIDKQQAGFGPYTDYRKVYEFDIPSEEDSDKSRLLNSQDTAYLLDWLFQQFNRTDGFELISLFRLSFPSLSKGDIVILESAGKSTTKIHIATDVGWSEYSTAYFESCINVID